MGRPVGRHPEIHRGFPKLPSSGEIAVVVVVAAVEVAVKMGMAVEADFTTWVTWFYSL